MANTAREPMTYEMAIEQRRSAIRNNRAAFMSRIEELSQEHKGEYALLRNGEVVRIFADAGDALQAAQCMYPNDARYSVEKIELEPIEMGMYAEVVVSAKR